MDSSKLLNSIKKIWPVILVFIITLSMRLIVLSNKTILQVDEPFSFRYISQNNTLGNAKQEAYIPSPYCFFEMHTTYSASYVKRVLFKTNSSIKSIVKDLKIYRDGSIDKCHPNLYYSVLRIWNFNSDYTNYKDIIKRSAAINILFFFYSFFYMYKLLSLIKPNDIKFCSLGLLFAYTNIGSISATSLIREYPLMEALCVASTYVFVYILKSIHKNDDIIINKKQTAFYIITLSLFLLSGYYSTIYSFIWFCFLFIIGIYYKKYNIIRSGIFVLFGTIFLTLIIYPHYFEYLINNQYTTVIKENISLHFISSLKAFLDYIVNIMNREKFLFHASVFSLIVTYIIKFVRVKFLKINLPKDNSKSLYVLYVVFLFVLITCYIITYTSPYKVLRYISSFLSIFSLFYLIILYELKLSLPKIYKFLYYIFLSIYLSISFKTFYLYYDKPNVILDNVAYDEFTVLKGASLPIIFYGNVFTIPNYIIYVDDNVKIRFEKDLPLKHNYDFDKYILVTNKDIISENIFDKIVHDDAIIYFIRTKKQNNN